MVDKKENVLNFAAVFLPYNLPPSILIKKEEAKKVEVPRHDSFSPEPMECIKTENNIDLKQQLNEAEEGSDTRYKICETCNLYITSRNYQSHMKSRIHVRNTKALTMAPDISDPNNHCIVCDRAYAGQSAYFRHLKYTHKIMLNMLLPDNSRLLLGCNECEQRFPSLGTYRLHVRRDHNREPSPLAKLKKKTPGVLPDIYDINHYCRTCEKKYQSHVNYYQHLRRIHPEMLDDLAPHLQIETESQKIARLKMIVPLEKPECMMCQVKYNMKFVYLSLFKQSVADENKLYELVSRVNPSLPLDDNDSKCDRCST
ncbi:hypothetical protein INT48_004453 [Thamnidium elegans]|uniref:C2H2-type domain-containing protein n=1 Tax=Thamnidium elegans TaxID=101142 RepID=A0A8H7SM06_9FUNG|nr:hypothetical protein INT48_004453 [Thamnidium elegans]